MENKRWRCIANIGRTTWKRSSALRSEFPEARIVVLNTFGADDVRKKCIQARKHSWLTKGCSPGRAADGDPHGPRKAGDLSRRSLLRSAHRLTTELSPSRGVTRRRPSSNNWAHGIAGTPQPRPSNGASLTCPEELNSHIWSLPFGS